MSPRHELEQLFAEPPRGFGPTPLWWWSGEEVTADRIEWQLRRFQEGGIHNLVVINLAPAGPTFGAPPDRPAWFSEAWWERFSEACAMADRLGMKLWMYDQIGFSGANIQGRLSVADPRSRGQDLRWRRATVREGRVSLGDGHELLAAYGDGARLPSLKNGAVEAPEGTEVEVIVTVPTPFDYLSPEAVERLLDTVYGEYERRVPKYLGTVIPGSFQDELPSTNAWSGRFSEAFRERTGYDLLDHGLALFAASSGFNATEAAKVRGDYYAVRTHLTEQSFFGPVAAWHARHGMLIGADQTNPARAGYPTQSTQLYTDYFRTHRWFNAVGSDHEGDAKVHSSMAHLYEHPRVWVESFHSSGWGGTLEETYDWLLPLLRSGGNLYNPHASYFSTVAGWFEWAPPSTDWRQPYWPQYRMFADAVARICSIMSWGTYDAQVAVLHPTSTAQAGLGLDLDVDFFGSGDLGGRHEDLDRAQHIYLDLCGSTNWFHWRSSALDSAGIAFDVIDDDSVQRARIADGAVAVASQSYRTVILPGTTTLETSTAQALVELLEDGGRVIAVGPTPVTAAGSSGDDDVVTALVEHPRLTVVDSVADAITQLDPSEQHVHADVPLLVRRDGDVGVALVTGAHPSATAHPPRDPGAQWSDYEFDRRRYARSRTITINAPVATAEAWNPATGERRRLAVDARDGASIVTLAQDGAPAWIVVWREGVAHEVGDRARPQTTTAEVGRESIAVSGPWTGELRATMDNTWGDLARPVGRSLDRLEIWHLDALESDGSWKPTRATFGQTVLVSAGAESDHEPLDSGACDEVIAGRTPLSDGGRWQPYQYSGSRGSPRDPVGQLGTKGMVPSEFVLSERPPKGASVSVRALVRTEHRGRAELIVLAGVAKRVWWNGTELRGSPGYLHRCAVMVDQPVNVLQYTLTTQENATPVLAHIVTEDDKAVLGVLGSGFALALPGGFTDRPEYMTAHATSAIGAHTFSRSFSLPTPVTTAALTVGAAKGLTVRIDGIVVGRQERVDYYGSDSQTAPQFFSFDVDERLTAGEHRIEVVLEADEPGDIAYVDLVALTPKGAVLVCSGAGWDVDAGGRPSTSVVSDRHWHPLESAYAAARPHPLPGAHWLRGDPPLGQPSLELRVGQEARPRVGGIRALLPAGTRRVHLPTDEVAQVTVAGSAVPVVERTIDLSEPLREPARLELRTPPLVLADGASFLDGPITLDCDPAPIELGEWASVGLQDWSGAVSYRTQVVPPADRPWTLDLGDLRGSVQVSVDDRVVGSAFCAPFRFTCEPSPRPVEVEITVAGTLAPYLHATTPTTWVFPSQLSNGLFGPVSLT